MSTDIEPASEGIGECRIGMALALQPAFDLTDGQNADEQVLR